MKWKYRRDELDSFQLAAGLFIDRVGSCALWVDMGLGKTVVVLTRVSDKIFSFEWNRVLVVGPPLVVSDSWPTELATWEHTHKLSYQELQGTTEDMKVQLRRPFDIDGISVHKLDRLAAAFKRGDALPWDLVVLDEASMFRNSSAKRWRHAARLTRKFTKLMKWVQANELIELTGTPSPNGLHQVWAQIALIDGGKRLGYKYKKFLRDLFEMSFFDRKITPKKIAMKSITKRLEDIVYTLREEDYVKLPPLISRTVPIVFPPKLMERYLEFERSSVLEWGEENDPAIRALSEGALYGKLLQFACGRMYTGAIDKSFVDIHDLKIQRIKECVEFSDGNPILIARTWQHSRARLQDEFPGIRQLKTKKDLAAWNARDIELAQVHPASIGHGTNIQFGGSSLIFYDHTPDLELYLQIRKRLHRRGQTARYVSMQHLTAIGTIEEDLIDALVKKEATQDSLREPMRRRLADVLRELKNVRT